MLLQAYLPNQGDGWQYTLGFLSASSRARRMQEGLGAYLSLIQTLGLRTAELHRAFATRSRQPGVRARAVHRAGHAGLDGARASRRPSDDLRAAQERAARRRWRAPDDACSRCIDALRRAAGHGAQDPPPRRLPPRPGAGRQQRLRDHRLRGRAGAHARRERARKHSPLRDVAGMLRSFSYAQMVALRDRAEQRIASAARATGRRRRARPSSQAYGVERGRSRGGLLALAEIEKLLYELRYELSQPPRLAARAAARRARRTG